MTRKQQIEFAIESWMATKDKRRKKCVLLWSEEIQDIADRIIKEIGDSSKTNKTKEQDNG